MPPHQRGVARVAESAAQAPEKLLSIVSVQMVTAWLFALLSPSKTLYET